ncbi:hypothetical protein DC030_15290, partial [Enterococcus faecalis]
SGKTAVSGLDMLTTGRQTIARCGGRQGKDAHAVIAGVGEAPGRLNLRVCQGVDVADKAAEIGRAQVGAHQVQIRQVRQVGIGRVHFQDNFAAGARQQVGQRRV